MVLFNLIWQKANQNLEKLHSLLLLSHTQDLFVLDIIHLMDANACAIIPGLYLYTAAVTPVINFIFFVLSAAAANQTHVKLPYHYMRPRMKMVAGQGCGKTPSFQLLLQI